jgi:uncharacterized peroxidase-related enzyme
MNRIKPLTTAEIPDDVRPIIEFSDQSMGFAANDVRIMAKWPELLQAMSGVVAVIYNQGIVSVELRHLIAHVASTAAGCRYCAAHTAYETVAAGARPEKLAAVWEFETSSLFSAAERAALRVAHGGGNQPNSVSDDDFAELLIHFSERAALEIVAVISLFGFLNRWNDTLATQLEDTPLTAMPGTASRQ